MSRVLWHASRAVVDRPTLAGRTEGENHANSGLGLFCATGPHSYIGGFGAAIYALTLKDEPRITQMSIRELMEMGREGPIVRSRAWFEAEGQRLAHAFDVIELVELGGFVSQAIVLRDDAIVAVKRMTSEAFLQTARDVADDMAAWAGQRSGRPPRL